MNLYLISQNEKTSYDTYDSAVVCAESEADARQINPDGEWTNKYSAWCSSPEKVSVELIGEASKTVERGIVLSSFNAG